MIKIMVSKLRQWFGIGAAGKKVTVSNKMFKAGLYQHYKGPRYFVYGLATHSENSVLHVLYAPTSDPHQLWLRPLAMFSESVLLEGIETQRFQFLRILNADEKPKFNAGLL